MPGAPVSVPARATPISATGTMSASNVARTPLPLIAVTSSEPSERVRARAARGFDRYRQIDAISSPQHLWGTWAGDASDGSQGGRLEEMLDLAGQRDDEARAAARPILHASRPAVQLGEPLHEREPDPDAAPGAFALPERLEDLALHVVGDPGSFVLDDDRHAPVFLLDDDLDRRAGGRVARRVVQQVLHDPLDLGSVHVHDEAPLALDPNGMTGERRKLVC